MLKAVLLFVLAVPAIAQPLAEDLGAPGLWLAWKRAQTNARVLYITAHPDDEDAATLTYLARGLGADVTLLSLTRGESGANVVTGDFFEALGKLREVELERAAQFYGVKVRHTSFTDFGFSKSAAETWRMWDQKKLLDEVRRICDEVRPQVVIARFRGDARDGHGQHTASSQIAALLFASPGQWKPKKFYTGSWTEKDSWTISVPVATTDAVLGRSYAQVGLEGYVQHRSQGMGGVAYQSRPRFYRLEASTVGTADKEESFFERLGAEVQPPPAIAAILREAESAFRLQDPATLAEPVERALALATESKDHDQIVKLTELRQRIANSWRPNLKSETPIAPVSVSFATEVGVVPRGRNSHVVTAVLRSYLAEGVSGTLQVAGSGLKGLPAEPIPFTLRTYGEELRIPLTVQLPASAATDYPLTATATVRGTSYASEVRAITPPGLRTTYLRKPARHLIRVVDVKVAPGLRVGYVMGSGDDVPAAIRQLGVPVEMLGPEELATGNLNHFTTLVLGIRAYAVREDVKRHNARLLDFVKQGGTLIVQYNTPEFDHNYGPFPYTMTARTEEVSEENSPVAILQPTHPVFLTPNRITPADFTNWVEQRGSKFWMTWAPEYTPLLETHDTNQPPQSGGWLEARHGQGLYIYCAYAWYRQLPAGVPGAYRLFANLLSRRP